MRKVALVLVACTACHPQVTQEATFRDPHLVTVYDQQGKIVTEPTLVDAEGRYRMVRQQGWSWDVQEPIVTADALYLRYPIVEGTKNAHVKEWLSLATPLPNVVEVRETREPKPSGAGLVFGILFVAAGTALFVDGLTRSGLATGQRVGEVAASALFLAPGIAGISLDVWGMLTPTTTRVIVGR